ncbi:hypothetical protein BCR43DRAFT_493240 [Syncephalastrum racemosum]|uniref:Uncharacterized protein n=1 Tax=Syncephalastrum racemosum TaxID=13706 RepID=A0A1X2HBL1_SYNRA|nr:hypothetical protein BCR43DRAFT_493240 [Syncephalastrum racemosum]
MSDTNWCTYCDNAVNAYSSSLYCSDECLRQDALRHHPMLGYDFSDLRGFLNTSRVRSRRPSSCALSDDKDHLLASSSSSISSASSVSSSMASTPPQSQSFHIVAAEYDLPSKKPACLYEEKRHNHGYFFGQQA